MANKRKIIGITKEVESYYNQGKEAKLSGFPIGHCPYGKGNPMAMCGWMGGWNDAVYIKPGLLEGEEILLGGDHAHSLRSCA